MTCCRTRFQSRLHQDSIGEGINTSGVPRQALSLTERENSQPVRPSAVAAVEANRLEDGGKAGAGEAAPHNVIQVRVTRVTASALQARESVKSERGDWAAA